jgi:putative Mg2+ transporter-C (MgtC) family protein
MALIQQLEIAAQLLLAALLSMVVGLNREKREKDAGLRTHMLVGIGACLFTALSWAAFPPGDPSRVASNVVTGIGFLGAGVIYKGKGENRIHDLTTAASIWTTAAIGMATGVGAWLLAICAALIVWLILDVFWQIERAASARSRRSETTT